MSTFTYFAVAACFYFFLAVCMLLAVLIIAYNTRRNR